MRVDMSSTHLILISLRSVFKHPEKYFRRTMHHHRSECISDRPSFTLSRALLVSKLSRYEFEKCRYPDLSEPELETLLRKRGSDYDSLLRDHNLHKKFEGSVVEAFQNAGVEAQVVNRYNYTSEKINWADIVCAVGGDGTFLMAAGKVCDNQKPVIGFNSDPSRSEGFLSLHKKYSTNLSEAVNKLIQGDFRWRFRSRIRIVLSGENINEQPVELHDQDLLCSNQNRSVTTLEYPRESETVVKESTNKQHKKLPVLALNEVFIGENLSARVSFYEMRINGGQKTKIKSSGLCVATGTGSTSWNMSINRLTSQSVAEVLRLLKLKQPQIEIGPGIVQEIAENFNNSLIFSAEDTRMGYTIRDLISAGVWPQPKGVEPRGFANEIEVKSRCLDAGLVIDGGVSFKFNDGMVAKLQIHECDSLRTVELNEN